MTHGVPFSLDLSGGVDYSVLAMSREEDIRNLRLYDRRVVERNIKKGLVSRKDYEKWLKSLPDASTNMASPDERGAELGPEDDTSDAN